MIAVHLRPAPGVFDSRGATSSARLIPSGVSSNAQDQRDWKSEDDCGDKHLHHPCRRFEGWEKNGSRLDQQPRHDRVRDRDSVNLASLQLG